MHAQAFVSLAVARDFSCMHAFSGLERLSVCMRMNAREKVCACLSARLHVQWRSNIMLHVIACEHHYFTIYTNVT
jgi:hypothetical protein